jgi:hypothetical protein
MQNGLATKPPPAGAKPRPSPALPSQFEGMRLKLSKTANGRYTLGIDLDLELADDELSDASAMGDGEDGAEAAFATDDAGREEGGDSTAGDGDGFATDDEAGVAGELGDDAEMLAGGEDTGESAYAGEDEDGGVGEGDDGEDAEAQMFAGDDTDEAGAGSATPVARTRWPNQQPVPKGVLEVSQAPVLFDEPGEAEEADEPEEPPAHLPTRPMPAKPAMAKPATARPAMARPAMAKPATAKLPVHAGTASAMLAAAKKTIGMGETPPGSNHNQITEWYNQNIDRIGNGPWCEMAVTYWAGHSANLPSIFAGKHVGYANTVTHAQKFQQKGRWHTGIAGIQSGDIVFYDWGGSRSISKIDHVGVVERVMGKKIVTIEGNTTGDRCRRVVRDSKFVVGYGRPAYARARQEATR